MSIPTFKHSGGLDPLPAGFNPPIPSIFFLPTPTPFFPFPKLRFFASAQPHPRPSDPRPFFVKRSSSKWISNDIRILYQETWTGSPKQTCVGFRLLKGFRPFHYFPWCLELNHLSRHFPDDIFICISWFSENEWICIWCDPSYLTNNGW